MERRRATSPYVSDTAAGILAAGEHDATVGETINLGSGAEITINDLARIIGRVTGKPVAVEHDVPRPGDVLRLYADVTRATSLLRYRAVISLEDGIRRLMAWYASSGVDPLTLLQQEVVHNWTVPQPQ
jgi:UDP-glucose 4-epimerase